MESDIKRLVASWHGRTVRQLPTHAEELARAEELISKTPSVKSVVQGYLDRRPDAPSSNRQDA